MIVRSRWIVFLVSRRLSGPSSGATSSARRTKQHRFAAFGFEEITMRNIVLTTVTAALIVASASQALAAQSRHHVRKETVASEQIRNARNAVEQPSQPGWQYSGWSAPAGR
jgi:hypothetical protein